MSSPPSNAAAAAAGKVMVNPYTKKPIVNPYQRQKQVSTNNESTNTGPPPAKRLKTPEDDPTSSATNSLTKMRNKGAYLSGILKKELIKNGL